MTGGMRMKSECDGYNASPAELAQAEREHDDLLALERGLRCLRLAVEWLNLGGYAVPRVAEEINAIKTAIGLLKSQED